MKIIPSHHRDLDTPLPYAECGEMPGIAYLLSQYPAISHTFFLKEVLSLKQLNFQIETCSINPPDREPRHLTQAEAEEASATYYLKDSDYWGKMVVLAGVLFRYPAACARGMALAIKLGKWDIHRHLFRALYLAEALLLGAWMKRRNLKHLHVHFGGPVSTVAMLAAHAWDYSFSITVHGPEEFYDVEEFHLVEKFKRARFIYCISDYCRSQVMKYLTPKQWQNIHVLPLGVDLDQFPLRPVPPETPSTHIVSVGRLVPAKGQFILLQSFQALSSRYPGLTLTLVGDGSDRPVLEQFVQNSGLSAQVRFAGACNHDETRALLAEADIFALPSFAEGVPVALMEAMAMGIPCVSTQIAGIPELIANGVEGILVPASSVDALTVALARLIDSTALRHEMGMAGRKKVEDCYNLAKNIPRLAEAFREELAVKLA